MEGTVGVGGIQEKIGIQGETYRLPVPLVDGAFSSMAA